MKMKAIEDLEDIARANAKNSPLLRLPAEIRAIIFKHAVTTKHWSGWVGCYHDISKVDTYFTDASEAELKDMAVGLPKACRQLYAETATLAYSENTFAFSSEHSMYRWLKSRRPAQRKAIRHILLPYIERSHYTQEEINLIEYVIRVCPDIVDIREDNRLKKYLDKKGVIDTVI